MPLRGACSESYCNLYCIFGKENQFQRNRLGRPEEEKWRKFVGRGVRIMQYFQFEASSPNGANPLKDIDQCYNLKLTNGPDFIPDSMPLEEGSL